MQNLLWLRNNRILAILLWLFVSLLISLDVQGKENESLTMDSPKKFVEDLVKAYQNQDDEKLKEYHRMDIEGTGAEFEKLFFASFKADSVKCEGVEILLGKNQYLYVGVKMTFLRGDKIQIPFYEYFLLLEEEQGVYQAIPGGSYPAGIERAIEREQSKWEKTKLYQDYLTEEKAFFQQSPQYAENLYDSFMVFLYGMPQEMKENLQWMGIIFVMAIVELVLVLVYSSKKRKRRRFFGRKV